MEHTGCIINGKAIVNKMLKKSEDMASDEQDRFRDAIQMSERCYTQKLTLGFFLLSGKKLRLFFCLLNIDALSSGNGYALPHSIFVCGSLTNLLLINCCIPLLGRVISICLRNLGITLPVLSENAIEEILHGCPVLEDLSIFQCHGIKKLNVKSECLKKFQYFDNSDREPIRIEIFCPSITSLMIKENIEYADVGPFCPRYCSSS